MQTAIYELSTILNGKVDLSHGIQHAEKVLAHVEKALEFKSDLTADQQYAVRLAALLHDADDHKYFPDSVDYENARYVLRQIQVSPEITTWVIAMIKLVSCSQNGNSTVESDKEWMLYPRYADRLEALGEIGLVRCWLYTKHVDRPLYTSETPRVTTKEELYSKAATPERFQDYLKAKGKVGSSSFIDHFYDKLLHIDQVGTNKYFVEECQKRMQIMEDFILDFGRTGEVNEAYLSQLTDKCF